MKKAWKGALIGGIIGGMIGLIGFTPYLPILSYFLLPLWLPLLFFTEELLGIELEGPCTSAFCVIPYGFFTLAYFSLVGLLFGLIITKILQRFRRASPARNLAYFSG